MIIFTLSLSGTVAALNQTLVIPLLPEFPGLLGVSREDASWLVTATLLVGAVAMPIVSRLADMLGKRIILMTCLVLMTAGSLLAGTGWGFGPVLGGRALQGFGMALIPIGISIMRDALPPAKVGAAVSLMSATLGIGGAMGLPLSGFLYTHVGWQWIFWCSAFLGGALVLAVGLLVPESTMRTKGRFDYAGALLLSLALTGILLVISNGSSWGFLNPATLAVLAMSVVVLGLWIPVQLKLKQPLVNLRISSRRPVLLTNIASVLLGFGMFANLLMTTQQLQLPTLTGYGLGLSVSAAGVAMVPAGLAMVVLSPLNGYLLERFGAKEVLIWGSVVMAFGYVARIFLFDSVLLVVVSSTVVGIGTAASYAAVPTLIMASVPLTETTSANGLNSLLRQIGTSTSSAAVAGVLSMTVMASDGHSYPVWESFGVVYLLASVACLGATVIVLFVPARANAARGGLRVP
jgi:MFS family permease